MRKLALALSLGAIAAAATAESLQPIPELRARVTDLTSTLSSTEQSALEQKLATFEARKGAQVAVLIVATTQPEEIEQYSIRVVDAWALGRAASDDGALLLVAKDDRALRIEVGRGLEGALTDATSNRIIDEAIVPRLRAGDFAGGIDAGVDRMLAVIDGEPLPPPPDTWDESPLSSLEGALPFALFAIPIAGGVLRKIFGRVLGPLLAGGVVFALVWFITGVFFIVLAFALFTAMFAALAGTRPRGHYRRGNHAGWGGFGGGGFGGGGFGGGGFSGGGGSFGGGGASGRW
ncbi:MAG: YgcG family protein [Deltaproteobacteria bacterium]|nr:YgcG family protein [Deltaproteobacteria bacterium]